MTAFNRIGAGVLAATIVAVILTLGGLSHGEPAVIGAVAGVIVQTLLSAAGSKPNIR